LAFKGAIGATEGTAIPEGRVSIHAVSVNA
jgi:hypothetical protein